jgi:S1-C subfamily serine protease
MTYNREMSPYHWTKVSILNKKRYAIYISLTMAVFTCVSYTVDLSFASPQRSNASISPQVLFDELKYSTVSVMNTIPTNLFNPQIQNLTELGTGYVFGDKRHIITAYHLLSGAMKVDILSTEGVRYPATLMGADPFSDVAILELNSTAAIPKAGTTTSTIQNQLSTINDTFRPVSMGNSSALRVGDPVVTIGYNFGSTGPSMTGGLVSKTDYVLAFPAGGFSIPNIIQSDVTVNPGNSGGPLVDTTGKVIGMIYGRLNPVGVPLGQFPGMTAIIPSNIVNRVASSIVENGYYLHPGIGIIGETLTPDLIQRMVNSTNIQSDMHGVFVSKLQRDGTADLAGLQGSDTNEYGEIIGGDIITAIDGISVDRFEQLLAYIQEHKSVGDNISFSLFRNGQTLESDGVVQTFIPSTSR